MLRPSLWPITGVSPEVASSQARGGFTARLNRGCIGQDTNAGVQQNRRNRFDLKALNLGTGVRISDVEMEKARATGTRKMLESTLALDPAISTHTEPYLRPEDQAKLKPETPERLKILSRLQSNAQKAAQQKRLEQAAR